MATQPGYGGANPGRSGNDPRGRLQNESSYQKQRFENQQGPVANMFAHAAGRGIEANYGDYSDIMNRYRSLADNPDQGGGSGGGGGGFNASLIGYNDPFKSYAGFTDFSQTGGYSPQDIANMRARGVGPVRAAYANAEREVGRQRSLQGGYSPNAIATQAKMAREQGQSSADAVQNVEAGLASERQKGRLAGLSGMSDIEKQRLAADLEVGKFNANAMMSSGAANSAAGASSAAASRADQFRALGGMENMYGATPGMAQLFGNQLNTSIAQGGNFGTGMYGHDINASARPGAWDQGMNRINDVADIYNTVNTGAYPWAPDERKKKQQP